MTEAVDLGEGSRPTFCLVHGRHHGDWCWLYLQDELEKAGWDSIAPNLPIEDPNLTLNDHALEVVREEMDSGAKEIIRVGWSWGANVIPRIIGATAVSKLFFIAGSFHPATFRGSMNGHTPAPTHSLSYDVLKQNPERGLEEMSEYVFYHDIEDKALKALAIGQLREHPRQKLEPGLRFFPRLPMEYILLTQDRALNPTSQEDMAKALDIEPVRLESGHSPMLSKPKKLAEILIKLAEKTN